MSFYLQICDISIRLNVGPECIKKIVPDNYNWEMRKMWWPNQQTYCAENHESHYQTRLGTFKRQTGQHISDTLKENVKKKNQDSHC